MSDSFPTKVFLAITGQPYEFEYVISVHRSLATAQAACVEDMEELADGVQWTKSEADPLNGAEQWDAAWPDRGLHAPGLRHGNYWQVTAYEVRP